MTESAVAAASLEKFEGRPVGPPMRAPDPVNQAMIRHWVEAMGDRNPVYVDDDFARAHGFPGVVAPATMLQAWIMRGYRATYEPDLREPASASPDGRAGDGSDMPSAQDELFALLDSAGFTSVVATNCEQTYRRPLVLGDELVATSVIESVSGEKSTGLGDGHFVTTRTEFTDQNGERVAEMRFRILRFRPRQRAGATTKSDKARRPRPAITKDNAFFFDGARDGKLLIQRCANCGRLRHPPSPSCPVCRSLAWDTVEASGKGTLYSYVVVHHPQVPGFDYPLPIGLIELEEGTRLVADLVDVAPEDLAIGMSLECELRAFDDELTLPVFKPGSPGTTAGATAASAASEAH